MINFKERVINQAVELFIGLILDAKDELKADRVDFAGVRNIPYGSIHISIHIAKCN